MVLAIFNRVVKLPHKIIAMLLAMIDLVVFPIPAIANENTLPANPGAGQAVNPSLPIWLLIANSDNEPFSGTTNSDSISVIRILPGGSEDTPTAQSVHVFHEGFEQPAGELRCEYNIRLRRGLEGEITIRMDKKGKTVIGE